MTWQHLAPGSVSGAIFALPNANPSSGTYGRITGTGPVKPRVMQAGLKLTF